MIKLQLKVTSRKAEKDILKEVGDLAVQFIKGDVGHQGKQGEKGQAGIQGPQGEKGLTGDKGERGIDGSKGEKGKDGDNGKDGAKGAKGEKGEAGKDGVTPKIEEVEISYTQVKDTPNIQEIVRVATQSSKTTSLVELDDVDYSSLTKTNGKYILGGGASTFLALTDTPDTYTGQGTKFVRVNGAETALEFATVAGGGDALTSAPLSQFAATTSLQLKNVISDETGSGALVFGTSPNITTPTGIVKGDVGLGSVVNADTTTTSNITDSLNKRFVTDANLTTIGNQSGTNTGDNATNTQYSGLAASKENAITGTTAVDFWSGAKTFVNFATTVRATVLTGLSLVSTTVISATDTALVALGSLQAQITALTTTVGTKVASVTAGTNVTVTGTATAPVVNAPTMTATVGGAVPTPPNNTTTFLRGDGTFAAPAGSGDMVLASAQTNSGAKTFLATTLLLRNVANTFSSMFTNTATAARTWTLKDTDGTIAFTSDITGTNSGINTGDNSVNTLYSGLVSNATHTGDATGATALTLATVNANVGSFGLAGSVSQFTVNAKGLITAAVNVAISVTASQVSDFAATVRSTVLTGLSLISTTVISATDTVLVALGSLQAQITALTTTVSGKASSATTISTTAPLSGGGDLSANRTLTTSMATNKLIGRGTAGTGVFEEITLGTNLSLSGTTLNAAGGSGSGITRLVNVISTPTTAGATAVTDYVYLVSGTTTLTLPTAVSNTNQYTVKRTGTNTVTVATTSAQTIDGSTTASINVQYQSLSFISDGSNWNIT